MRWRASGAEAGGRLRSILILLGAFILGFGGAALAEATGLELTGEGRLLLGGALGIAGALLTMRMLRGED